VSQGSPRSPTAPLLLVGVLAAALGSVAEARADDGIDEGATFKSVALEGNPLGLVIGRYSADLEYLPAPHHALHLTPVGYFALPGTSDELVGFGAETGYRWYSSADGPQGIFAGASFIALSLRYLHAATEGVAFDAPVDTSYVQLGGALDVGYQLVFLGNFAVGAGAGVQITADTTAPQFEYPSHPWHDLLYGAGVRPRALLSVGTAF
jgi:hypothetical protein